ncbi:PAS domain S-box protein [Leptolyngbya sp. FACHB-261]|uniref:sensor histidine kinase n=1 Tax=Leptolyngbya sp. FACHB-261 TaxID=2692806 RepID=UPI0016851FB2|nr:PAS domain S-box protein [Leptolyngbya sp. FACHB-261]MBD2103041.1 PAS domain S-box protein [Leptolyngbya sp. FACHB-261]
MQAPFPPDESTRLNALHQYEILDTAPESDFDDLTRLAAHICGTPIALVSLVDENRQWFKSKVGLDVCETPRDAAFCAHTILQPDLLIIPDTLADERFAANPLVTSAPHIRFYAGMPLTNPQGFALGSLCVIDHSPRQLRPDQIEALRILARQVITQMELRRNLAALQRTALARQQAEAKLAASQAQLQAMLEHMPGFVALNDLEGQIQLVSPGWRQLFAQGQPEPAGRHLSEFFAPERVARLLAEDQAITQAGKAMTFEEKIVCADGLHTYLKVKFPLQTSAGEIYGVGLIALDITERQQIEAALRESEARFRIMADSAPVMVWMTDPQACCSFVNQPWLDFTGRSLEQELGHNWVEGIHPDDKQFLLSTFLSAFDTRLPFETEYRLRRADGKYCWILERGVPRFTPDGSFAGYIGSCLDITNRKQDEAKLQALTCQLQQQNDQLEEASRLKSEFLTNMSHELRTPLTSVLGFSKVLLEQFFGPLTPKQQEYISLIRSSGEHLLSLINDLLDLAKIEAGKLDLNLEAVELAQVCKSAIRMVALRAQAKQQQLVLKLPLACEWVVVDPQRVTQMLLNYLSNAVKFTPEGGSITLSTRIATAAELADQNQPAAQSGVQWGGGKDSSSCERVLTAADYLVLSVQDTGIGIPAEKQYLLFESFQQVDGGSNRQHEGTGLGLALTRRLAEMHGGTVSFTSAAGQGSTFSVWLPLAAPFA